MLLHALRCAEPDDRDRAVQILAKRRPSADGELGLTSCWIDSPPAANLSQLR